MKKIIYYFVVFISLFGFQFLSLNNVAAGSDDELQLLDSVLGDDVTDDGDGAANNNATDDFGDTTIGDDGGFNDNVDATQGNYQVNIKFDDNDYKSTFSKINSYLSFLGVQNFSYVFKIIGFVTCLNDMGLGKVDGKNSKILLLNGNCQIKGNLVGYYPKTQ